MFIFLKIESLCLHKMGSYRQGGTEGPQCRKVGWRHIREKEAGSKRRKQELILPRELNGRRLGYSYCEEIMNCLFQFKNFRMSTCSPK